MMDHGFFDGPWGGYRRAGYSKEGIAFLRKVVEERKKKKEQDELSDGVNK